MFLASLNNEIIKYVVIAITVPFWWPFLKALYAELNDALREEGGLLGRPPSKEELRAINQKQGHYQSPLVSEDYPSAGGRRSTASRAGGRSTGKLLSQDRGASATRGQSAAKLGFARPRSARGFSRKDNG